MILRSLTDWIERRRSLREYRAFNTTSGDAYAGFFDDQIGIARDSLDRGAHEKALQIWRLMHANYSYLTLTSEKAFRILIEVGHLNEAEIVVAEASKRFPRHRELYAALTAHIAYKAGDHPKALILCEQLRRRFPRSPNGYTIAADCHHDLGQTHEAENILRLGVNKAPNDLDLAARFARAASARLDWTAGLERWTKLWNHLAPTIACLGQAECLRQLGRFDEAETVLSDACERFPMNPWPFAEHADLATLTGHHESAVARWQILLNQFPGFDPAYPKAAAAMRTTGRDDDADHLLQVGMTRSPGDLAINLECARSADRRGDHGAAADRWATVIARFPDCTEALAHVRLANRNAGATS